MRDRGRGSQGEKTTASPASQIQWFWGLGQSICKGLAKVNYTESTLLVPPRFNISAVSVEADKRTKFSFDALSQGKLGITKTCGAFLAEAACYCLFHNQHPEPVGLKISGDADQDGVLEWSRPEDENLARRTYADLPEAAEKGAYGVAIIVVTKLENIPAVEQSPKGTGVDYWLSGDDDTNIFKARLEVSGILKGTPGQVQSRLLTRLEQTEASDYTKIPALAAIVEFSFPEIRIAKRNSEGTV